MIRDKVPPGPRLSLLPVLSWTQCEECRKEVRFERMWSEVAMGKRRFVCRSCASDRGEARRAIHQIRLPPRWAVATPRTPNTEEPTP